jgi:Protein of unknown function (DUF2905)
MSGMARTLIVLGAVLIVAGLLWPWILKLGFGRLPGDIVIERGGFRFYFPIVTYLLVSLVVSGVLWLFRR